MDSFSAFFQCLTIILALLGISLFQVNGQNQISAPCTPSMISNFTPCFNYMTGSSSNGSPPPSAPSADCCHAFRSLMSSSVYCTCLIVTANVPLLPINRTLSLLLPQACNGEGVPLKCTATGSPLPAPGPTGLGPSPSPRADAPLTPQASKAVAEGPTLPPEAALPMARATSPMIAEAPTQPKIRPTTSHRASSSSVISPSLQLMLLGFIFF